MRLRLPLRVDEPESGTLRLSIVLAPNTGAGKVYAFMEQVARVLAVNSLRIVRLDLPHLQAACKTGRKNRPNTPSLP